MKQWWHCKVPSMQRGHMLLEAVWCNRVCRQSRFPTFISCQRQDPNVLPKRRQSHQGDKLCDVSTVPLVARWPVLLARGSDADSEPHNIYLIARMLIFNQLVKCTESLWVSSWWPLVARHQHPYDCVHLKKTKQYISQCVQIVSYKFLW